MDSKHHLVLEGSQLLVWSPSVESYAGCSCLQRTIRLFSSSEREKKFSTLLMPCWLSFLAVGKGIYYLLYTNVDTFWVFVLVDKPSFNDIAEYLQT